jgi:hypothetical protein
VGGDERRPRESLYQADAWIDAVEDAKAFSQIAIVPVTHLERANMRCEVIGQA